MSYIQQFWQLRSGYWCIPQFWIHCVWGFLTFSSFAYCVEDIEVFCGLWNIASRNFVNAAVGNCVQEIGAFCSFEYTVFRDSLHPAVLPTALRTLGYSAILIHCVKEFCTCGSFLATAFQETSTFCSLNTLLLEIPYILQFCPLRLRLWGIMQLWIHCVQEFCTFGSLSPTAFKKFLLSAVLDTLR